jgi:hypothetical protein
MRKKQLLEKLSKAIYITSITSFLFAISVFIYTLSKSNYVSLRKNTETLAQLENKEEMKREIRKEIEQEINNKKLALLSVEPQGPTDQNGAIPHPLFGEEVEEGLTVPTGKDSLDGLKEDKDITGPQGKKILISKIENSGVLIKKEEPVVLARLEEERAAKRQCERNVNAGKKIAKGTAVGMIGEFGSVACAGFLGLAFLDLGLSYATCVAASTAVGSAADDLTICDDVMESKLLEQNKEEKPQTH